MTNPFCDPTEFPYRPGSLFLGKTETGQDVGISTEIHAITIGGSGAGKGVGLLIPNARRWPHNLFVIDPKGENAILSWKAREAKGQRVGVLDPFGQIPAGKIPDRLRISVNPLADIDPDHPRSRAALVALGSGMIVSHDPRHMEWTEGARALLAGLAAYVVTHAPPEKRTFASLRDLLMMGDNALLEIARRMATDTRCGGLIRASGTTLMTALAATRGMEKDFLGNVRRATQWLDDAAIAKALSASTFKLSDLKSGEASLFLVLPPDYIQDYSAFLRLFVKAALHVMGAPVENGRECLFLLDEFYSLGKLDELSEAAGRMRSAGVHLWPFLQGLGQLEQLYGQEGAQAFLTNADAHVFLGNDKDAHTLNYISRRLGVTTMDEVGDAPTAPVAPSGMNGAILGPLLGGGSRHGQTVGQAFNALDSVGHNIAQASYQNEMNEYQQRMARVGRPIIEPHVIARMVGKGAGETVARSIIVFGPAGRVLNIRPAPYFLEADHATGREALIERKKDELRVSSTRYRKKIRLVCRVLAAAGAVWFLLSSFAFPHSILDWLTSLLVVVASVLLADLISERIARVNDNRLRAELPKFVASLPRVEDDAGR